MCGNFIVKVILTGALICFLCCMSGAQDELDKEQLTREYQYQPYFITSFEILKFSSFIESQGSFHILI